MNSTTTTTIATTDSLSTSPFGICRTSELSPFIDFESATASLHKQHIQPLPYALVPEPLLFASVFIAFCVSLVLTLLHFLKKNAVAPSLRLHLVGIGRPSGFSKSTVQLLDNIDTGSTFLTVSTDFNGNSTVLELKNYLRHLYSISFEHELVIVFSHHILRDEEQTFSQLGIFDNSLLTLAICPNTDICDLPEPDPMPINRLPTPEPPQYIRPAPVREPVYYDSETDSDYPDEVNGLFGMYDDYESSEESQAQPVDDVNQLFGMFKRYESSPEPTPEPTPEPSPTPLPTPPPRVYPCLGFDVIMQEDNVLVHQMPGCGCEMNHESLYLYAMNTFSQSKNLYLTCPHNNERNINGLCSQRWHYNEIQHILQHGQDSHKEDEKWMDCAKLELLSARNTIENKFDCQKCPRCETLYYRPDNREDKLSVEEIKTKKDLEKEFKFECVLCCGHEEKYIEEVENPAAKEQREEYKRQQQEAANRQPVAGVHEEDLIEEDIDAQELNALFADSDASDDEEDYEHPDEIQDRRDILEAVETISHMFDFDEPDTIEVVKVKVQNEFCFCCGAEWCEDHVCDTSFREDMIQILDMADTKKIGEVDGVPSVRACVYCSQLIFHTEACKHMNCHGCGKDFCFVCLKPTDENGNWQCGSHCDKCPVADRQNDDTLPDTVVITKKSFQLY